MTIGERLAALMELRTIRPSELSRKSGVQPQTIYSMLQRKSSRVAPETLRALAEALDAPISYFYDEAPSLPVAQHTVPLLGDIAAGVPIFRSELSDEMIEDTEGKSSFALHVAGDSMAPLICRGDVVFIKEQSDVLDGEIAAVNIDGEVTLKRVYHLRTGVQLVSENPDYDPMLFTRENSDAIRILGRAHAFKRTL